MTFKFYYKKNVFLKKPYQLEFVFCSSTRDVLDRQVLCVWVTRHAVWNFTNLVHWKALLLCVSNVLILHYYCGIWQHFYCLSDMLYRYSLSSNILNTFCKPQQYVPNHCSTFGFYIEGRHIHGQIVCLSGIWNSTAMYSFHYSH